jgi:hypothetical protein
MPSSNLIEQKHRREIGFQNQIPILRRETFRLMRPLQTVINE